jgi:hypothetical protein
MNLNKFRAVLFLIFLLFSSCSTDNDTEIESTNLKAPDEFNSEIVVSWFNLIKILTTETPGYTPPVAAKAFGYTGVALYEI